MLSLWILDSDYHSHYSIRDGTIENVTMEDVLSKRGFCLTISLPRMSIYILEHNNIHYKAAPKKFILICATARPNLRPLTRIHSALPSAILASYILCLVSLDCHAAGHTNDDDQYSTCQSSQRHTHILVKISVNQNNTYIIYDILNNFWYY